MEVESTLVRGEQVTLVVVSSPYKLLNLFVLPVYAVE